jgi:hypothetical protein
VFGTPDDLLDLASRSFNLVLAMQDLKCFDAADFDVWYFSQSEDNVAHESESVFAKIAEKVLLAEPTQSQIASLEQAWNVVPYWRLLESSGPWAGDPVAEFAAVFLHKLDRMKLELSVESALACQNEFCKLLELARSGRAWRTPTIQFSNGSKELPGNFQPSLLVLVEGVTETILLPRFLALTMGSRGKQDGAKAVSDPPAVMFLACGGANQLLRKYLHMRDISKLPILCVMDHDAVEQIETIQGTLREIDHLHVWRVGEIEDTFSQVTLLDSLNAYLQSLGASELLQMQDLLTGQRRTELLDRHWRNRGLGDFDKVGFAEFHVARLKQVQDIPQEGRQLMATLKQMTAGKHGGE